MTTLHVLPAVEGQDAVRAACAAAARLAEAADKMDALTVTVKETRDLGDAADLAELGVAGRRTVAGLLEGSHLFELRVEVAVPDAQQFRDASPDRKLLPHRRRDALDAVLLAHVVELLILLPLLGAPQAHVAGGAEAVSRSIAVGVVLAGRLHGDLLL